MQLWTTPLTTNTVLCQSRNSIQEITRKDFITWKEAKWASLVESMKNEWKAYNGSQVWVSKQLQIKYLARVSGEQEWIYLGQHFNKIPSHG